MKRIMMLVEPEDWPMYRVQVSVIDEGGEEVAAPEWAAFSWLALDVLGEEKPWQKVLREIAGLID